MSDHTDHVLEAIDGAIRDAETSPDAMRWTPEPQPDPAPWIDLDTWQRACIQEAFDLPHRRPVHPAPPRTRAGNEPAAVILDETHDWVGAVRFMREFEEAMRQSVAQMLEDITPALQALREAHQQVPAAPVTQFGRRPQPDDEPTDPWERALHRQRNRNTGPARNPHARLGKGNR